VTIISLGYFCTDADSNSARSCGIGIGCSLPGRLERLAGPLLPGMDDAADEIDVGGSQARDFSDSHSDESTQQDRDLEVIGHRIVDGPYLLRGEHVYLRLAHWRRRAPAVLRRQVCSLTLSEFRSSART
jgi:hypothetical protein